MTEKSPKVRQQHDVTTEISQLVARNTLNPYVLDFERDYSMANSHLNQPRPSQQEQVP
jgi:hypothetical protein